MHHYLVPQHITGTEKNLEYQAVADDIEDAEDWFVDAKERMLDVNGWKRYSRNDTLAFALTDVHGRMMSRHAHKGDHIRIEAPGNGPRELNAHDWVVIEAIEYDDYPDDNRETFALRMCAAIQPEEDGTPGICNSDATGTIVIERKGKVLSASYHGRNDAGNEDDDDAALWLGITDAQCAALLKGLIE